MLSKADEQRIGAVMKHFDCSSRESEIYMQALKTGQCSVQSLARDLGYNRVTVHSAVEQLIKKGFLFETRKGKRRLVVAEDPDILRRLMRKKKSEMDIMSQGVEAVTALLSTVRKSSASVPTVKFYEGVDGLKKMLEETLSSKSEVLVFTYVDLFSKLLSPKYLESYYEKRAKKDIRARLIFPTGEFGTRVNSYAKNYKMEIRFLPSALTWKSGIFAWDNTIAIQSFTEEKVTCTIIENEDIARFYRNIVFELCWQQATPMKPDTKA